MTSPPRTLAEKIWDAHLVRSAEGEPDLLYIDLHLIHEVTSPQAFDGLRDAGRPVRRPDLTVATEDHNVPTLGVTGPGLPLTGKNSPVTDPVSREQMEVLRKNCAEFGITLYPMGDASQGVVHVIGPQLGLTQPRPQRRPKTMAVNVEGALPEGVSAKDLILAIIGQIGTGGGQGYVIEYRGEAIRTLSMEGRMTVCNMSIEAGARAGLVAPDEVTFAYLKDKKHAPAEQNWADAVT